MSLKQINAKKRNWAKFRVKGALSTMQSLAALSTTRPDEKTAYKKVIKLLKEVIKKW